MLSQILRNSVRGSALLAAVLVTGAGTVQRSGPDPKNPHHAPKAPIDRFSTKAGKLQVRTASNGLPAANQPVNFDQGPFITQGLGPDGSPVRYYNFDVQSTTPSPLYLLVRDGEDQPVKGQLPIVDQIPGDAGYSDFGQIVTVTVPRSYRANEVTSLEEIRKAGYKTETTSKLINRPIVPGGSTARLRFNGANSELQQGWYRGQVVFYFTFEERPLQAAPGKVPVSPIYVSFNLNPDQPNGGPASGFLTEKGSAQTHNVVQTVPGDAGYSPLWLVNVYDNADFSKVSDLASALKAKLLAAGVASVNCPVVWISSGSSM